MVLYILFLDTSYIIKFSLWSMDEKEFLLFSIGIDVIVTALAIFYYLLLSKEEPNKHTKEDAFISDIFKATILICGLLFFLAAIGYHIGPYIEMTKSYFLRLPMVSNSAVKVAFLAMICFYVWKDPRKNMPALSIVIVAHIISIIVQFIYCFHSKADVLTGLPLVTNTRSMLLGAVGLDTVITAALLMMYLAYWKKLHGNPTFLRPGEFRSLQSIAHIMVGETNQGSLPISSFEIAKNVDRHLSAMTAVKRWIYNVDLYILQLLPVMSGYGPFSEMSHELKTKFIKNRFYVGNYKDLVKNKLSNFIRASIRIVQQLSFVGYYSDEKTYNSIGYTKFSERSNNPPPPAAIVDLDVLLPHNMDDDNYEADVCIVGSGAGGSILAYELLKQGRSVLMLEKGKYVRPIEFNEDEVQMIGKLYGDGVFQQTRDFKFTILQGNCVGGSTVVNNAVCFDPPQRVIKKWNDEYKSGIDITALNTSIAAVRDLISVKRQTGIVLNPGDRLIDEGLKKMDPSHTIFESNIVEANITGCLGCGYCNIGCKYGKKMSMLDVVLPLAQKEYPNKLKIVAECKVDKLISKSGVQFEVGEILATLSNKKQIRIKANTVILSAGPIASSYILKSSGIGSNLPVGKHLCFNVGAAAFGVFNEVIDAYAGLQISHYYKPKDPKLHNVVFESWYNPPVSQAINSPQWFEKHFANMKNFNKMLAIGLLVGSESEGTVKQALTGGPDVIYSPNRNTRENLAEGLILAGKLLFASGAKKVLLNTWSNTEFTSESDLDKIRSIVIDTDELAIGSGHPQGGNAISTDKSQGVVDENFKVHGYSNLYICDGSVIPSSLGVNPQLTIMALAHYASSRIH